MSDNNNNDDEQILYRTETFVTFENNRFLRKEINILEMHNKKTGEIRPLTPEEEEEALLRAAAKEAAAKETASKVEQSQNQSGATAEMLPATSNCQNQTSLSVPSPVQRQTTAELNEAIFQSIEGDPYDPNSKKRYERVIISGAARIKRTPQGHITVEFQSNEKSSGDSDSN